MKYEKPDVEVVMTDEEDVITASIGKDDPNTHWSGFY